MYRFLRLIGIVLISSAVSALVSAQPQQGVDVLLGKARSLEARGRTDLAAQTWNQVLLVNPNQTEALAGLARYAKETGDRESERKFIDRLRQINPNDPAIAAIEKMHFITPAERNRLEEAGRLAMQHKPDDAMKIYRAIFGAAPPPGKWAEAFYETQAASTGGREKTIAQLRELCVRDPDNEVYRLWLGRLLTYDAKTRPEGLRLLQTIRDSGPAEQARSAWRQALVWDKENPAIQEPLEAYLQRYSDPDLANIAAALRQQQQRAVSEADERRGFQALSSQDVATAQGKFEEVLRRSPGSANAVAGLGFVRLQQKRFEEALRLFERARQLAPQRADVRDGYETAKFWMSMQRGAALQASRPDEAIAAYEAAGAIHPHDDQPLLAIAQIQVRQGNLIEAAGRFEQVIERSPNNTDAIAGLAFVRLNEKRFDDASALFEQARRLAPGRSDIEDGYRSARFWGFMGKGAAALEENRPDAAISNYQQALALNPHDKDALLGLAGAAERKGNPADAVAAYGRLAARDPGDVRAWLGLIRAQIGANDPAGALEVSRRIPPAVRQELEARSDYLAEMSLANYAINQTAAGDQMLGRALEAAARADTDAGVAARLRVAGLLMSKRRPGLAVPVYQQAVTSQPENAAAWRGLIEAYAAQGDFGRAMAAVRSMPRNAYETGSTDAGFLSTLGAAYAADGQCGEAERLLSRSLSVDNAAGRPLAEGTQMQLADVWMRERRYDQASRTYRDIVGTHANSTDAWRGYITALHKDRNDGTAVAEARRMPAGPRTQLENDPAFLVLLAGAHSSVGQHAESVELLQRARSAYQSHGAAPPADLDVQLGWAMLSAADHGAELREHLAATRNRNDLTLRQREAIDTIATMWSLGQAETALQAREPERAISILADARRDQPQNPKVHAALAYAYVRQHQYREALAAYRSWGMAGAEASDFRSAAGAALAADDEAAAGEFLLQARRQFPDDPDLLHMSAGRAIAQGSYDEAERDLRRALAAAVNRAGATEQPNSPSDQTSPVDSSEVNACRDILVAAADSRPANQVHLARPDDFHASDSKDAPQIRAEQLQDEIDLLTSRNTPFLAVGGPVTRRAGDPGINRLVVADGVATASVTLSNSVRLTAEAHAVSLSSGVPDGRSGYRFGTLPLGAKFRDQSAVGLAGELQVSTGVAGLAVGVTPDGFLTRTWTGGLRIGAADGPVVLTAVREPVKDSLLSYAGALDPGSGTVWGGVVANSLSLQLKHDASASGQYALASAAFLRGRGVADNWNAQGILGAYWRVVTVGQGGLSVGLNAVGMHYDKNLNFFSLGHGGYFSPQRYLLGSIPISWSNRHRRVEYEISGSGGVQYIEEDYSPFFPTRALPVPSYYNGEEREGLNYNAAVRVACRIGTHWSLGIFAAANNARDYDSRSAGVTLTLLTSRVPTTTGLRLKSIPDWKGRQPYSF